MCVGVGVGEGGGGVEGVKAAVGAGRQTVIKLNWSALWAAGHVLNTFLEVDSIIILRGWDSVQI